MFTFLTISYNQEKYMIEHLESIKYQVESYAMGRDIDLILADDASKDKTVSIAKKWLKRNTNLFKNIKILESNRNNGIVANYIRGINALTTERYKCLAADDLYYIENVIDAIQDYDMVFSPTLFFTDERKVVNGNNLFYYCCAGKMEASLTKEIRKQLSYYCGIQAPGSFLQAKMVQDERLQEFLGNFKWIEDYPQWHYIFNLSEKEFSVGLAKKPYILYRTDVGISFNSGKRNNLFVEEDIRIKETIGNKLYRYRKYVNVYCYAFTIKKLFIEYIKKNINRDAKQITINYDVAKMRAEKHLQCLKEKADKFTDENDMKQ